MALLHIIKYGNPILRMKAEPIQEITAEHKQLAADMIQTMQANDGIGLAAPQVAQSIQMIVVDYGLVVKGEAPQAFINPEIMEDEGSLTMEEGCLSVPELHEEVTRAERIRVKYQNIDGEPVDEWLDGVKARVVQHEVDHLKGIFFVDRISSNRKKSIKKDLRNIAQEELSTQNAA